MTDLASDLPKPANGLFGPATAGYIVLFVVVMAWAGFALSMRAIGASPLAPADVAVIRFAIPIIALLPALPARLSALRRVSLRDAALVLLGGVPFFLIVSEGARTTSTAYVGALIAGTAPLSVALLSYLFERRCVPRKRWLPLALILAGVAGIVAGQRHAITAEMMRGVGFLLLASLVWGAYTIGLKRTGVDAISNGLLLSVCSLTVIVAMMITGAATTHLGQFTLHQALPFVLVQGVGVGLVSTVGYAFAVSRLGASRSSAIGSLAPALASLLAIPVLGEGLTLPTAAGILVITTGVILANRY
ncbi:DMT family transporter [Sinorhizobium sp. BG8]|uniref:DMT family transporter n=1 Tax=Sinorhizobium sp. BG8 TaxID=2613773 RepID=UPI00193C95CB|nr:DMT family transporter [Sinorhizobium sp. BG8]QRM56064.1 DMT family transporter [Sinorhizobium sp. BG8]